MDDPDPGELGPTLRATRDLPAKRLVLLSNHGAGERSADVGRYVKWVATSTQAEVEVVDTRVSDPSDHVAIHQAASDALESIQRRHPDASLHLLLSAGTPAMHSVWLLLGKARFRAELVKCSIERGTEIVELPFEISTDFAADLLERSDQSLTRLTQGLPPEAPEFSAIIAGSRAMNRAVTTARILAPRSVATLILGESGTGKELFARAIHDASPRRSAPFVAINCGAIPDGLIDSRLFGHKKGAFTGADRDAEGVFEAADGGTLFLDEIGELPLEAQVRLLRTLQEGSVVRIGDTQERQVDVRIVAATHVDLFQAVEHDRFRSDLLYRLAVGIIHLPPLRDRGKDLHALIDALLREVQDEMRNQPDFTPRQLSEGARSRLAKHAWPGNVRELRTTLVRAALFSTGDRITRSDVEYALLPTPREDQAGILTRDLGPGLDVRALEAELRAHYVARALDEAGGVKAKAARLLNVPAQTFQHWAGAIDARG